MYISLQEAVVIPPHVIFSIRSNPGFWEYVKVSSDDLSVEAITAADYLKFKEMVFDENWYTRPFFILLPSHPRLKDFLA